MQNYEQYNSVQLYCYTCIITKYSVLHKCTVLAQLLGASESQIMANILEHQGKEVARISEKKKH